MIARLQGLFIRDGWYIQLHFIGAAEAQVAYIVSDVDCREWNLIPDFGGKRYRAVK